MADYSCLSHQELYDRVQAGDRTALAKLADDLHALRSEAAALADALRKNLAGLAEVWQGPAAAEYQRRVGTIPAFAHGIGDDLTQTWAAVGVLGDKVGEAKRTIPPPQDTDDHGQLLLGGLVGVFGGAAGAARGVVGGYLADEQQKKAAKAEAVRIANALGNVAEASRDKFTQPLTPPPPGIPVPGGAGASTPAAGLVATAAPARARSSHERSAVPAGHGHAAHAAHATHGGAAVGAGLAAASPAGVAGGSPAPVAGGPSGAGTTSSAAGSSGVGSLGGIAGIGAAGAIGSTARGSATGGGLFDKPVNPGPAGSAVIGSGSGTGPVAPLGRSGGGTPARGGHDTWLTEDDMVWTDEAEPPPGVLGAQHRGNSPGH